MDVEKNLSVFLCVVWYPGGKPTTSHKRLWTDSLTYGNRNIKPTKVKAASLSNSYLQHLYMSDLHHCITLYCIPPRRMGMIRAKCNLHQASRFYQHLQGWNLMEPFWKLYTGLYWHQSTPWWFMANRRCPIKKMIRYDPNSSRYNWPSK